MYRLIILMFVSALIMGCGGGGGHGGNGGAPPVVTAPTWQTATMLNRGFTGQADGRLLTVTGGTTPYTITLVGGALPNGVSLSTAINGASLGGTPSLAGQYSFTLGLTDAKGLTAQQSFSWRISAPIVIATTVPTATKGVAYSTTLTATGGVGGPYTSWTTNAGSLPPGLILSSTGVLAGTPTVSGSSSFSVSCSDSGTDLNAGSAVVSFIVQ